MKNELTVVNQNGQPTIDSREIAERAGKRHCDLIEKIDGYIQILENGKFRSQDFFIESSYTVPGNNKVYKCYLCTKKGCELIANKMPGEKGILFAAAYVTTFEKKEIAAQNASTNLTPALISQMEGLVACAVKTALKEELPRMTNRIIKRVERIEETIEENAEENHDFLQAIYKEL
jgi:phage regulator Rha-like protein